jgi:hypothetical protein
MDHNNRFFSTILLLGIILTASFVYAVDQPYILTFTERQTVVLLRITRTDTGIRTAQPIVHNFGRIVGTTAVDPIIDAAGTLRDLRVYVSFLDANNARNVSLLRFNSQFEFLSETPLTKISLGGFYPLHIQKFGSSGRRLFGPGRNNGAQANDYVSYTLDDDGIPTGARKIYFNNAAGLSAGGGFVTRDGGMAGGLSVIQSATGNPLELLARQIFRRCLRPIDANANAGLNVCNDSDSSTHVSEVASSAFNGTRDIVFREFRNPDTQNSQSRLRFQKVNASTGEEISTSTLTNFVRAPIVDAEFVQGIALSEDGRLVVFNSFGPCQREIVKAFRRGSNGLIAGGTSIIYGCNRITNDEVPYGFSIASLR